MLLPIQRAPDNLNQLMRSVGLLKKTGSRLQSGIQGRHFRRMPSREDYRDPFLIALILS